MKSKLSIPLQVAFFACTFVSGLDYAFGIGVWKSYVQLFGWLELLLTAAGAVLAVLCLAKRGWTGGASALRSVALLLWLMQFCPALYSLMLGGFYFWYALFHCACILLGGGLLLQPQAKEMNELQPN